MSETEEEALLRQALEAMQKWQQHKGYNQFLQCEELFMKLHRELDKYFNESTKSTKKGSIFDGF
jgi:hypothetical protein